MAIKDAIEDVKQAAHQVGEKVAEWMPWNWGKKPVPVERSARGERPTDLVSLRGELDDLFDRMSRSMSLFEPAGFAGLALPAVGEWPQVDIEETDSDFVVLAELPGMDTEDIQVSLEQRSLTISGEKKRAESSKRKGVRRVESFYGSFRRSIPLPAPVRYEHAKATYKRGELVVELPKAEPAASGRKVPIGS